MVGNWAYWLEIEILGLGERPPGSQRGGLNGGQKESRSGCPRVLQGPTLLCAWYVTTHVKWLSLDLDSVPGLCRLTVSAPGQPWCSRPFTSFHKKFNHTKNSQNFVCSFHKDLGDSWERGTPPNAPHLLSSSTSGNTNFSKALSPSQRVSRHASCLSYKAWSQSF